MLGTAICLGVFLVMICKVKVFRVTVLICLVIVTCFVSVALFSWVKRHNNPALDYVDLKVADLEAKVTELEASISRKIKESEVAMLQELLTHLKERDERDVAEVSEPVKQREEEVMDSVPCCGGEDNLPNFMELSEEEGLSLQEYRQERADFRASLDERGLLELKLRIEKEMKESPMFDEEDAELFALTDMLMEREPLEVMNRGSTFPLSLEEYRKWREEKPVDRDVELSPLNESIREEMLRMFRELGGMNSFSDRVIQFCAVGLSAGLVVLRLLPLKLLFGCSACSVFCSGFGYSRGRFC